MQAGLARSCCQAPCASSPSSTSCPASTESLSRAVSMLLLLPETVSEGTEIGNKSKGAVAARKTFNDQERMRGWSSR